MHRVHHARNDLPQYRRGCGEIQPREAGVPGTKRFTEVQPDSGVIQKELAGAAWQFQAPTVEPGQICRLRHPHCHTGKFGGDGVRQPLAVRAQMSQNLVQPVLSFKMDNNLLQHGGKA